MKAKRGCWTCKQRKIGCDKTIPRCNNCNRSQRLCEGYGIRLNWPDQLQSRRDDHIVCFVPEGFSAGESISTQQRRFCNTTYRDFALAKQERLTWLQIIKRLCAEPSPSLTLHLPAVGNDAMLLTYYEQIIAPMCSTTRAWNGFQFQVLPMALSSRDKVSRSLCNSMLAISAHHRQLPGAALAYKVAAMKGLHESVTTLGGGLCVVSPETTLATAMMLCMYSVFDEEEAQFHAHLEGAKKILSCLPASQRRQPAIEFLVNWILYYDILSNFAQPFRDSQAHREIAFSRDPQTRPDLIVGLLGCSIEVFDIISSVNKVRAEVLEHGARDITGTRWQMRVALEEKLRNLTQNFSPDEVAHSTCDQIIASTATAELYRLATLLYLLRVVPVHGDEVQRSAYLDQAFMALEQLRVATSPWPVFIIACESRTEEQRMKILDVLDCMDSARNVGNVRIVRNIIQTIWRQQDLRGSADMTGPVPWWLCIESRIPVPWFT
ncbi:unnamed protein product [Cercospora beticola]|nr:unnamed protein product [Cercospora beticola]